MLLVFLWLQQPPFTFSLQEKVKAPLLKFQAYCLILYCLSLMLFLFLP
jgi:hypothetical protein